MNCCLVASTSQDNLARVANAFRNNCRKLRPKCRLEPADVHDFIDPKLKRVVPYGVHDITNNVGGSVLAPITTLRHSR